MICRAPGQDILIGYPLVYRTVQQRRPNSPTWAAHLLGMLTRRPLSASILAGMFAAGIDLVTLARSEECVWSNILKSRIRRTCLSHLCGMGIEMRYSGQRPCKFTSFYKNVDVLISPKRREHCLIKVTTRK
ncbi:hypothetical protein ACFX1R_048507 [Malus domestica]